MPIRSTERSPTKGDKIDNLTKKFAYVIIGCGVSGSAALGEILSNSKGAKNGVRDILVIDSQKNEDGGRSNKSQSSEPSQEPDFSSDQGFGDFGPTDGDGGDIPF